jgi:hypothetical protein
MKKTLIVLIALFAMVAFVSGAVAQQQTPQSQKTKAPGITYFKGTVMAYEAGKMIKVKGAKGKEVTLDIAPDAVIQGDVKEGAKVAVAYKKDGDKVVATGIKVAGAKKETPQSQKTKAEAGKQQPKAPGAAPETPQSQKEKQ